MTDAYTDYLFDESRVVGHAEYIAFPQTEEELVTVVRYCDAHNLPLTAQGGLTGLTGGASPDGGLILNLSKMNRILGLRKGRRRLLLSARGAGDPTHTGAQGPERKGL